VDPFRIRPIEARDDRAMAEIIRRVMLEFGADGPGFAIHDREVDALSVSYARGRRAYYVVELDDRLGGGGGIAELAGADLDTCELRKMYFLPWLRGRGAGHALLSRCLATARMFGYRRCYVETLVHMQAACALYETHGFRLIPTALGATGHFGCNRFYLCEL
jgi:putative acetyltransferase